MASQEWMKQYEAQKEKLECKINLEAYFTEKEIKGTKIDQMEIGMVSFPTGTVVACDPLVELGEASPYLQTVPAGIYPVSICVALSEKYGDRYACVKVAVSGEKPVRHGLYCRRKAFRKYWEQREDEDEDIDLYNDLFDDLLAESYEKSPRYQREGGDWLNWTVPGTDLSFPIFTSGWGDGVYPCYFGYDAEGRICGLYIHFIDIERY